MWRSGRPYKGEMVVLQRWDTSYDYLGKPIWKHVLFRTEWAALALDALWKAFGPVKDMRDETCMYLPCRAAWMRLVDRISQ